MQTETHEAASDGWSKFTYSASDGLKLAGRKYGWQNLEAPAVVCLAGLTRNSADFHGLAMHLAYGANRPNRVLCLDYRGRGMSQYDRDWRNYNILTEADDTIAGLVAAGLERATFVGTSRGGLIIFALTAIRPTILQAVVLNDIGPQVEATGLVRIKNYLENTANFSTLEEAAAVFEATGRHQFPDWDRERWLAQADAILEMRDGKLRWRYDRKLTRTLAEINLDRPLPQMWPQFAGLRNVAVMAIRGENSDIISARTVEQMRERHERLQTFEVARQGHAPDLGVTNVAQRVERFIASAQRQS